MIVEGSLELRDGRMLSYVQWGDRDAPAVVYCHGTPGSRWELLLAEPALHREGVQARVVAFSRPGYGSSSFSRRLGFSTWARDVDDAADRLGIATFAVLGASGGSPFALACGHALPDRVTRLGIVAGVAPPDAEGMNRSATLAKESANPRVRKLRYGALALGVRVGLSSWLVHRLVADLGDADRQALDDPAALAALGRMAREAFAQHGRAAAHESGMFLRPWNFDPGEVGQPTQIWHGGDDTRIPPVAARSLAERLPNATYVLWPQHGHFSWATGREIADVTAFLTGAES